MLCDMPEKKLIRDAEGIKVYGVSSEETRKDCVSFSDGDNWKHNKRIPEKTIELSTNLKVDSLDFKGVLLHELIESQLMDEFEMDYDEAHLVANVVEGFYRKTEDLQLALDTLVSATGLSDTRRKIIEGVVHPKEKTAAEFDQYPWATAGREVAQETPEDPTPAAYIKDVLEAPSRRSRFFDVAGGTYHSGAEGILKRYGDLVNQGLEMQSSGVSPFAEGTPSALGGAIKSHFSSPAAVQSFFGSPMSSMEALRSLGPVGLLTASRKASDPVTWAKAFGTAARTPAEQMQAKRILQAALTLHAARSALGRTWNTAALGEALGKTPYNIVKSLPALYRPLETGAEGYYSGAPKDIPVMDPRYFSAEESARIASKYGVDHFEKIAKELNGDWPTARDPNDRDEHLYHTVKKDGKVVGMVKVRPHVDGFFISNLWVRPGDRSSGTGKALMERVLKHYGDKKLYLKAEIYDHSPLSQEKLENWYKKFGFIMGHEGKMYRPVGTKAAGFEGFGKIMPLADDALMVLTRWLGSRRNKPTAPQKENTSNLKNVASNIDLEMVMALMEKMKTKKHPKRKLKLAGVKMAIPVGLYQLGRSLVNPRYARLAGKNFLQRARAPLGETMGHYMRQVGAPEMGVPLKRPFVIGNQGGPQLSKMDLAQRVYAPEYEAMNRIGTRWQREGTPGIRGAAWSTLHGIGDTLAERPGLRAGLYGGAGAAGIGTTVALTSPGARQ